MLCLCVASLLCAPLAAQDDEPAQPTREQIRLNKKALDFLRSGQREAAVDAFRQSLAEGELNITWLNLGRALLKGGQCAEAREAFGHVRGAPQVKKPAPEKVEAALSRFMGELETTCSAFLSLDCEPAEARVSINGAPMEACPSAAVRVDAGELSVYAEASGVSLTERKTIAVGETAYLRLDLKRLMQPDVIEGGGASGEVKEGGIGWIWVGVGALSFGGGVAVDNLPASSRNATFEALDLAPVGLYVLGAAALIYGLASGFGDTPTSR